MVSRIGAVVLLLSLAGTSCSKAPRGSADLNSISAIDYYSKLPESPVTYFLPPDGALAAQPYNELGLPPDTPVSKALTIPAIP